jgi:dipeptidyl aminopeptidase/acylaminoacyl peptidase
MNRFAVFLTSLAFFGVPSMVFAEGKRPMTVEDLFAFKRVADPQVSPDGRSVAYALSTVDLAGNKSASSIWIASTEKGEPRQLTNVPGKKDRHPRWSPDGKKILFTSNRSGDSQLWVIDLAGGEARQLTTISTGAEDAVWSPDGKRIAFASAVYPEYSEKPFKESDAANKKRKEEIEKNPVKAKVFTKLFYRHWDSYVEDKRQHIFVITAEGGEPKDVTPGDRDSVPTSTTFATGENFTFSPDGKYLVFTAVPATDEAWNTNYSICRVPVTGGTTEWECLTKDNPAASSGPLFSPDGTRLAYRAQKRAGFEADRWQLMLVETDEGGAFKTKPRSLTSTFDRGVDEYVWAGDGKLYLGADDNGSRPIFVLNTQGDVRRGEEGGMHGSLSTSRDGTVLAYSLAGLDRPPDVFVTSDPAGSNSRNVSEANKDLLAKLDMPRPESVTVKVEGADMQMWVLKPPGFDASKKWPLAYLVHGGPQGAWEDGWSYRWNPEAWAAQGYVVALPNPRGSTGFGQKFVDDISGDWGGKCFDDLMKGVDYMESQPYIDKDRVAAAGASFGGYMMDWFQGHTTRFKTLITHCGVYNFESMYATTEEIWFDEWEHGGPPWGPNHASYEKHSPHKYAKNFKTPMLIIHNDLDFRVPVSEGQQLFTTLQRLKVPSKFINFPDEGHWVLKPQNSAFWHREVFAWLKKYVPPGGKSGS